MRKSWLCLVVLVVFVAAAALAGCAKKEQAAGPTPAAPPGGAEKAEVELPEVTLTAEMVDNWIASATDEQVKSILDQLEEESAEATGKEEAAEAEETPAEGEEAAGEEETAEEKAEDLAVEMAEIKDAIMEAAKSAELETAVKGHGFKDAAEWGAVTLKVMAGLLPAMSEQVLSTLKEMGVTEESEEYKKAQAEVDEVIDAVSKGLASLTDAEKQVVKDKLDALMAAFEEEKEGTPGAQAAEGGEGST